MRRTQLLMTLGVAACLAGSAKPQPSAAGTTGAALDLSHASVTFEDDFNKASISNLDGKGPWFAGASPQFGRAPFLPFGTDSPVYVQSEGFLTINLVNKNGKPVSGALQTVDKTGNGFSQTYGYFEMRARFPDGDASWPAFWLKSVDEYRAATANFAEVDIVEEFNDEPLRRMHHAILSWLPDRRPAGVSQRISETGCDSRSVKEALAGRRGFHTYGADLSPDWITFFYDRRQVCRLPATPETRRPMFMLMDLAYRGRNGAVNPPLASMTVDYVRVWQRDRAGVIGEGSGGGR